MPFRWCVTAVGNAFEGFGRYFKGIDLLTDQNEALRQENESLQEQIELSKAAGLKHVKPHKDHMFSNVGLIVLANTIDPEAVKLLKKTRFRKNYKLSFYGWTEFQLAAMEVSTNCFYANPAGAGARNIMEQNFAPKKGRN